MINTINKSKVDIETSDIFFNFGAKTFHQECIKAKGKYFFDGEWYLRRDAKHFLEIVDRPNLTYKDLVNDFLKRS